MIKHLICQLKAGKNGFWTDFNDVRFVQVFLQEADGTYTEVDPSEKIEDIQQARNLEVNDDNE